MSTAAKIGKGSTIKWNTVKLTDVKKIGNIPLTNAEVDVTDLDSLAKEFIAGLKDYGTCTLEGNYVGTGAQADMLADAKTGAIRAVEISLVSLSLVYKFNAFIKSFNFGEATPEGVIPFTAELRITGEVNSVDSTGLTTPFFAIADSAASPITPTPAASGSVYNYIADVITTITYVKITPTATAGVIKVNGTAVGTGAQSGELALGGTGTVTDITISVEESGKAPKVYVIHIYRAIP